MVGGGGGGVAIAWYSLHLLLMRGRGAGVNKARQAKGEIGFELRMFVVFATSSKVSNPLLLDPVGEPD